MATEIKRNIPRDLFLHLLAIITLYWSAISFVAIIWQFINNFFPYSLDFYAGTVSSGIMRFSISSLVIVFPIFILVSWFLNRIYMKEAGVRESKIRKWLIYLTLFISSIVVIVDLVRTVNAFLGGEITVRFILKAVSILLVAGFVFVYYLDDVRKETPTKLAKIFAWISSILVVAVLVYSFILVGSPTSARLYQYDQQKIYDLQSIQSQVVNYWQKKGNLPAALSDLNDPISNFIVAKDPQTQVSYEYNVKDKANLTFELCANFNQPTTHGQDQPYVLPSRGIDQNWNHSAGRMCFERTIDKQLYPPLYKE